MALSVRLEQQIAKLAGLYGTPRRTVAELATATFVPLTKADRIGEVCMVVRRSNGRLLTARKTFYPPGAYRLLTGGISPGEDIAEALLRETDEETGLQLEIRRFLAVIEYRVSSVSQSLLFASFAFLLDETGGVLGPRDESERLESFREVLPHELPSVAESLEQTVDRYDGEIRGNWREWGRFRAVLHREVFAALTEGEN